MSEIENGGTGKVVHEVTSTGAVYYGDNSDPGDINETAQFAIAADLAWRWPGDNAILQDNYSFIKAGEHYLASPATGPDHLWTAGDGIVENPSLGGQALDVASETIQALAALHDMAVAMGDGATANWAAQPEKAMLGAFGQWWIASQHLYADSLCVSASVAPPAGNARLHRVVRPVRGRRERPDGHQRPDLLPGQHRGPGGGRGQLRPPAAGSQRHGQDSQPAHRADARLAAARAPATAPR